MHMVYVSHNNFITYLCTAVSVSLKDGYSPYEGRVEISHNKYGKGSVCDTDWDLKDASVVCKMLGYRAAKEATRKASFGEGKGRVFLTNVDCTGLE